MGYGPSEGPEEHTPQFGPTNGRRAIICAMKLGRGYLCTEQWRASLNP